MKTKKQKQNIIEEGINYLKNNENLIFVDFTGAPTKKLNELRQLLKQNNAYFKVFKKRLFNIVFLKNNLNFPLEKMTGQLGVIFIEQDEKIQEIASLINNFQKEVNSLKILGGFNLKEVKYLESDFIKMLGSLPSREVLLSQFIFLLTMPIKKFLFILNEKAKRS